MRRTLITLMLAALAGTLLSQWTASAQSSISVQVSNLVSLDEQFNVVFIVEGETSPTDFQWSPGDNFQLVWGPQKGTSTSVSIVNGKTTRSSQSSFTYILLPRATGKFDLPSATCKVKGKEISSKPVSIEVVGAGASSQRQQGGSQQGGGSGSQGSQQGAAATGSVPAEDLFMRFTLSKGSAVIGEPITATLKLYQVVNVAGFEDARFPTFNGFWSKEVESPTNIEFKREKYNDKIYYTAVLRRYVIIPQRAGTLTIDPAELVVLVNVRAPSRSSSSIFDDFFDSDYRTVRKRITTPATSVNVKALPAGAPASFGGGVGEFEIKAKVNRDTLSTHEAASLVVTISGKGNVSLLEAPKVTFPHDVESYDTKATENTDRSGTTGSKTFEYPFIPRSHGDFEIEPVQYTYYDVSKGRYVTLSTPPIPLHVKKGADKAPDDGGGLTTLPSVDRKGVKNLGEDIRFIATKAPAFKGEVSFLAGSPLYWIILAAALLVALGIWLSLRKVAAMRADVAGTRNRKATRMAMGRLKTARDFQVKGLQTAFYEELHRALLGFISDKLDMGMEELSRDNIASRLQERGVPQDLVDRFLALLDACEYARFAPDSGSEAMKAHYDEAVDVISHLDSSMKSHKNTTSAGAALRTLAVILALGAMQAHGATVDAQPSRASYPDSLWSKGVQAYTEGAWEEARGAWEGIVSAGVQSAELYYNIGNACYKGGDIAYAVLNYERALKIDPSYADARYNLSIAEAMVQDRIDAVPEFFLKVLFRKLSCLLDSNTWAWTSIALFVLTLALVLLFLLGRTTALRKTGFFCAIPALLLWALTMGLALGGRSDYERGDRAVVTVPVGAVRSSPSSESSKDLFLLHEGTTVKILDEVGEWRNVQIADGRQGWMKKTGMEVI